MREDKQGEIYKVLEIDYLYLVSISRTCFDNNLGVTKNVKEGYYWHN